jgi:hypothetical protein
MLFPNSETIMKLHTITSPNDFVDSKSIPYTSVIKRKILNKVIGPNQNPI